MSQLLWLMFESVPNDTAATARQAQTVKLLQKDRRTDRKRSTQNLGLCFPCY